VIERRPTHVACTSLVGLYHELEQLRDDDSIAMPAFLARKLVREADSLERTRIALLWIVLAAVLMLGLMLTEIDRAPRAPHERAHPGEQL
jgi:hypothetical protein